MKPPLLDTAVVINIVLNEYGDFMNAGTAGKTIACRFRAVQTLTTETNRSEETSDSIVWAEADSGLVIDSVLLWHGDYYRVKQVNEARDLDTTTVYFLKCVAERVKDTPNVS